VQTGPVQNGTPYYVDDRATDEEMLNVLISRIAKNTFVVVRQLPSS
jgi:hypothetical protein